MKNNPVRICSASGIVFFCLTSVAPAQQFGSAYATPASATTDQNIPSATASQPQNLTSVAPAPQFGGAYVTPVFTNTNQNIPGTTASQLRRYGESRSQQDPPAIPARSWSVVPRVRWTETLTDNVNLSAQKEGDLVSTLAPGVRINANTARLNMVLDYDLVGYAYARNSDYNNFQNYLNTFGTLEAIDNWFFVDFSGYVSQQMISPFGTQSVSNANINANRAQTQTYQVSPYIRGQLGGDIAEYFLRYNATTTRTSNGSVSDVDISQWIGQVRGGTPFQNLAWTIDGSQQNTDYSLGRDYDDERVRAILTYRLFPQLRISGSGGQESNNYITINNESYSTYGYGLDWRPTDRTIVAGFQEKRFFGWGHNVNISHRFPLTGIQYTDVQDVAFLSSGYTPPGQGTVYDQYDALLANQYPDPVARAAYINNLLNQAGIAPNSQAVYGYLNNRPQVRRTQQLSLVLYGARNSITFRGTRITDETLWVAGGIDDPTNPFSKVIQTGYSAILAHRLTPLTSLNVGALYQKTDAPSNTALNNDLTMFQVGVSSRLGARTVGTINARRSVYSSESNPYNENALSASLIFSF